jgi:hypothetical protein
MPVEANEVSKGAAARIRNVRMQAIVNLMFAKTQCSRLSVAGIVFNTVCDFSEKSKVENY